MDRAKAETARRTADLMRKSPIGVTGFPVEMHELRAGFLGSSKK